MIDPADLDDLDTDADDSADGVWLPPESLRALMGRPRHRPGARLIWSGATTGPAGRRAVTPAQYVAAILGEYARTNGAA